MIGFPEKQLSIQLWGYHPLLRGKRKYVAKSPAKAAVGRSSYFAGVLGTKDRPFFLLPVFLQGFLAGGLQKDTCRVYTLLDGARYLPWMVPDTWDERAS